MAQDWEKKLYAGWNGQGKSGGGSQSAVPTPQRRPSYREFLDDSFRAPVTDAESAVNVMMDHPAAVPRATPPSPPPGRDLSKVQGLDGAPILPGRSEIDPGILGRAPHPGRDPMPQPSLRRVYARRERGKA